MRMMVFVKATEDSEAGVLPTAEALNAMMDYNEQLLAAGIMVGGDGLTASSRGKRVRFDGADRIVMDGPFAETKEVVAGYWIWEVASMDEAVEWLRKCPNPMPGPSEIEIRPIMGLEEFGDIVPAETGERWTEIKAEAGAKHGG